MCIRDSIKIAVLREEVLKNSRSTGLKKRVAQEAALLLYTGQEKEYKQAKIRATRTLGIRVLPSNLEVATELDKLAEEREGPTRQRMLVQKRKDALQIMKTLQDFHPKLVGSVWRGTANQNSDIDITVFSANPDEVLNRLEKSGFRIITAEWNSVTKRGREETSFHIHFVLESGNEAEIVVRSPEQRGHLERCEIYGDTVKGLSPAQLEKVLEEDPFQKFLPKETR